MYTLRRDNVCVSCVCTPFNRAKHLTVTEFEFVNILTVLSCWFFAGRKFKTPSGQPVWSRRPASSESLCRCHLGSGLLALPLDWSNMRVYSSVYTTVSTKWAITATVCTELVQKVLLVDRCFVDIVVMCLYRWWVCVSSGQFWSVPYSTYLMAALKQCIHTSS